MIKIEILYELSRNGFILTSSLSLSLSRATAACAMEEYLGDEDTPLDEVTKEITQSIYGNSLPLFRKMIENGYVRLTILDHKKVRMWPRQNERTVCIYRLNVCHFAWICY